MTIIGYILVTLLFTPEAFAQTRKPMTIAELVTYNGKDREQVLYAGAKSEGKLTWYTSLAGDLIRVWSRPSKQISRRKNRSLSSLRLRHDCASVRGVKGQEIYRRRGGNDGRQSDVHARRFSCCGLIISPHFASYPEDAKEKGERGLYFWAHRARIVHRLRLQHQAAFQKRRTEKLRRTAPSGAERPDGSLDQRSGLQSHRRDDQDQGTEFVKKLKAQEIALHTIIPPALLDLIASGEVLASPAIFRNHTLNAIAKGAPVDWVPMDIVPTNVGGAAIAVQPPHPHARSAPGGLSLGTGRPSGAGKIRIWQRNQKSWL